MDLGQCRQQQALASTVQAIADWIEVRMAGGSIGRRTAVSPVHRQTTQAHGPIRQQQAIEN